MVEKVIPTLCESIHLKYLRWYTVTEHFSRNKMHKLVVLYKRGA